MRKISSYLIMFVLCMTSIVAVSADDQTAGDDLIETTFYGNVTDNKTDISLAGVYMVCYDSDFNNYRSTYTDDEGNYYFEFNFGGVFYIFAEMQGYETAEEVETVDVNEKTEVNFELEPITYDYKVYGTVTDADSSDPISDVDVQVLKIENDYIAFVDSMFTGADGRYSIDLNNGSYEIHFFLYGYDYITKSLVIDGQDVQLDVQMEKLSEGVTGTVTNEDGDPMQGVEVTLVNDMGYYYDQTDVEGKYQIYVIEPGVYTLSTYANGYRPFSQDITIEEGENKEIDIQMQKAYLPDPILHFIYRILLLLGII